MALSQILGWKCLGVSQTWKDPSSLDKIWTNNQKLVCYVPERDLTKEVLLFVVQGVEHLCGPMSCQIESLYRGLGLVRENLVGLLITEKNIDEMNCPLYKKLFSLSLIFFPSCIQSERQILDGKEFGCMRLVLRGSLSPSYQEWWLVFLKRKVQLNLLWRCCQDNPTSQPTQPRRWCQLKQQQKKRRSSTRIVPLGIKLVPPKLRPSHQGFSIQIMKRNFQNPRLSHTIVLKGFIHVTQTILNQSILNQSNHDTSALNQSNQCPPIPSPNTPRLLWWMRTKIWM